MRQVAMLFAHLSSQRAPACTYSRVALRAGQGTNNAVYRYDRNAKGCWSMIFHDLQIESPAAVNSCGNQANILPTHKFPYWRLLGSHGSYRLLITGIEVMIRKHICGWFSHPLPCSPWQLGHHGNQASISPSCRLKTTLQVWPQCKRMFSRGNQANIPSTRRLKTTLRFWNRRVVSCEICVLVSHEILMMLFFKITHFLSHKLHFIISTFYNFPKTRPSDPNMIWSRNAGSYLNNFLCNSIYYMFC